MRSLLVAVACAALATLAAPAARATTVVNGDFESGDLRGWHVAQETTAGNWFAYTGTAPPIGHLRNNAVPVQPPPQGRYAAITDEANPDSLILYQDVAVDASGPQQLNLLAYYDSQRPLAVPSPATLAVAEGQVNQQFRIDVMRPQAPLGSLEPGDVLATVLATPSGGAVSMKPTWFTADLTPFAGQTVRLRIANAVSEEVFNAGVDAVSVTAPPGQGPGAARLTLGAGRANPRSGVVTVWATVPGPGRLQAATRGRKIQPLRIDLARAGRVRLRLRPGKAFHRALLRRHRLRVRLAAGFTPAGGVRETASRSVVFRLRPAPHRKSVQRHRH